MLKDVMLGIKAINFWQDNAGCYHSAATILGIHLLASKHNVSVRMDFSDPQGGKGACDRKAASVKSHMKTYFNAGNDIKTAEQMKEAIEAPILKWEGVSSINNVKHEDHGMRVWRAYGIGKGHFVSVLKLIDSVLQSLYSELKPLYSVLKAGYSVLLLFCSVLKLINLVLRSLYSVLK